MGHGMKRTVIIRFVLALVGLIIMIGLTGCSRAGTVNSIVGAEPTADPSLPGADTSLALDSLTAGLSQAIGQVAAASAAASANGVLATGAILATGPDQLATGAVSGQSSATVAAHEPVGNSATARSVSVPVTFADGTTTNLMLTRADATPWQQYIALRREHVLNQLADARIDREETFATAELQGLRWSIRLGDGSEDSETADLVLVERRGSGERGSLVVPTTRSGALHEALASILMYSDGQILTSQEEVELFMRLLKLAYERKDLNLWVLTHTRTWMNDWTMGLEELKAVLRDTFYHYAITFEYTNITAASLTNALALQFEVDITVRSQAPLIGGQRTGHHQFTLVRENNRWRMTQDVVSSGQGFRFFNRPPRFVDPPTPANLTKNVGLTPTLSWGATDPDDDNLTYDILLGTTNPPLYPMQTAVATNTMTTTVQKNRTYYWYVIARDPYGKSTRSSTWRFTTFTDPDVPQVVTPVAAQLNVPITDTLLKWTCTDPDNNLLTYAVRLDTANPPQALVQENLTEPQLEVAGPLTYGTNYYWQVIARNAYGGVREGPVWRFQTRPDATRHPQAYTNTGDATTTGLELKILQVQARNGLFDLFFRVLDQSGRDINQFNRYNFAVAVNNDPVMQDSTYVSTHRTGGSVKCSLIMDYSYGMASHTPEQATAALTLTRAKAAADQWQVVKMSDLPKIRTYYAALPQTIEAGILTSNEFGRGVLFDAISQELTGLGNSWGQKAIVVFTAGGDGGSIQPVTTVVAQARRYSIPLLFVAMPGADLNLLQNLADDTNGAVFQASSWATLNDAALGVDALLKDTYHITFNAPSTPGQSINLTAFYQTSRGTITGSSEAAVPAN